MAKIHLRGIEQLECRRLLAADLAVNPLHNLDMPADVDGDGRVGVLDLTGVVSQVRQAYSNVVASGEPSAPLRPDVNNDQRVSVLDLVAVASQLLANSEPPPPCLGTAIGANLSCDQVSRLLDRAAEASASNDAIIAIVDREGRILGVRTESEVDAHFTEPADLVFAIDGAVAKARTAAFFSSSSAPLPSRTVRFISQSTITQREVESSPNTHLDPEEVDKFFSPLDNPFHGPGLVAPIGVGGHFPPEIPFTPPVDLFAIEHQSRDSAVHPGEDGIKGTGDDLALTTRFDATYDLGKDLAFPESYGFQSEVLVDAQSRGIATLPGGLPIYELDDNGAPTLVGGIGVFFPGPKGFASFEQRFEAGVGQSELSRVNAPKVLESEWIALAAIGQTVGVPNRDNIQIPLAAAQAGVFLPLGRIDLVGLTLESIGPHPTTHDTRRGVERILAVGNDVGRGLPTDGTNQRIDGVGHLFQAGETAPGLWIVSPKDSGMAGGLTAANVQEIIENGIDEANRTRAAIRLSSLETGLRPGERTRMVLAVTDTDGDVLGLFRMQDATIFSIDVSVAKARNTSYYADESAILEQDNLNFVIDTNNGQLLDSLPKTAALTNRSIRFLSLPRFPSGDGEDGTPGPFSNLNDPGINSRAENDGAPLPASVYMNAEEASVVMFDAFNVSRNFRDPDSLQRQNGIVFFPGSSALYKDNILVGGLGVSGDGVDQDDVVTVAAQAGFGASLSVRGDRFALVTGPNESVRIPYQKFNRNPFG
jgi:uncharacterized protein GlcG (DUF336 family)